MHLALLEHWVALSGSEFDSKWKQITQCISIIENWDKEPCYTQHTALFMQKARKVKHAAGRLHLAVENQVGHGG
jgi:hypothetical protein